MHKNAEVVARALEDLLEHRDPLRKAERAKQRQQKKAQEHAHSDPTPDPIPNPNTAVVVNIMHR